MKKAFFTLALFVMAFGNMGFAQNMKDLRSKTTEQIFKQYGLVRESYIVPQQANYNMIEGLQYRTTYYYDEWEYTLTEEIIEKYEDAWTNQSHIAYEYDFNGNVMEKLIQMWLNDEWIDMTLVTYEYDGDVISEVIYQFNMGGTWVNQTKQVYNFNGDQWTVLFWNWNGNNWTSDKLSTYTRNGNTIEVLMQYMEGGAWQNEAEAIYTLDFDENITDILYKEWSLQTLQWENVEKTTYVYDNGVYTDQYVQHWDGSAWYDENHYAFEYDGMGNAKRGKCYAFDGNDWVLADGNIDMACDYNAETKSFYCSEVEMVYVDLTSLNENSQASGVKVYPVPARDEISIQAENFQKAEVYSLTGQKLMESMSNTISVSILQSGVYMLKVVGLDGNSAMRKIVVQ